MKLFNTLMCVCFAFNVSVVAMNSNNCSLCALSCGYPDSRLIKELGCAVVSPFECNHKFHVCCLATLKANGASDFECPICHASLKKEGDGILRKTFFYLGNDLVGMDGMCFDGTCNTCDGE